MKILDDSRFTTYLHVDKKSGRNAVDFVPELQWSHWVEVPAITVNWAGYSMVEAEMNLIETALKDGADYLHLLQGADLPLKTPEKIDRFFENRKGKNFILFQPDRYEFAKYKLLCKHYFVDFPSYRKNMMLKILNHSIAHIQKIFINSSNKIVYHSSGCASITREFATYLVERRREIRKTYRFALAPDELFICNMIMHSPFRDTLGDTNAARLIDWDRREGNSPRTFTMEDYDMLHQAINQKNIMFARKFHQDRDLDIVRVMEKELMKMKEKEVIA